MNPFHPLFIVPLVMILHLTSEGAVFSWLLVGIAIGYNQPSCRDLQLNGKMKAVLEALVVPTCCAATLVAIDLAIPFSGFGSVPNWVYTLGCGLCAFLGFMAQRIYAETQPKPQQAHAENIRL